MHADIEKGDGQYPNPKQVYSQHRNSRKQGVEVEDLQQGVIGKKKP
jgi:hypothetical protein